jgi:hypothetical protein
VCCSPIARPGNHKLPCGWEQPGDSDAFTAPARVTVKVTDTSSGCTITLSDPADGQPIDFQHAEEGKANNTVKFVVSGHRTAYLSALDCDVWVSPTP